MSNDDQFKLWKRAVKAELKRSGWRLRSVDWDTWRLHYFDDGMTAEEAVDCEMDAAMQDC
jgi:hypothetical protein